MRPRTPLCRDENTDDDGLLDDGRLHYATGADVNRSRMLPIRARQCATIAFRMSSTRALPRKRMPASVIPPGVAMFSMSRSRFAVPPSVPLASPESVAASMVV